MTQEGFKRKLTAILSADVVGYSRLMRDDEEATVRDIAAHRVLITEIIQQHHGRVIDSPGDNILAEFASVVDAVNGAIKIQDEIKKINTDIPEDRQMAFRIGINLGDVIEEEGRIYGDGVNIAARVEGLAAGGGIAISGTVYEHIKEKLSLGYHYLGEQNVKNISEPVRVYRILTEPADAGKMIGEKQPKSKKLKWAASGATALIVLIIGGIAIWNYHIRPSFEPASVEKMAYPLPDKPSIAVLPFDNMSGDPGKVYLSDGITEQIITSLSKMPSIFVISRTSTFSYKGKPVKVQQVAEELGIRYVLEGSVQQSGDKIRISAQLIDALSGRHLWAERYERNYEYIFALQDEITLKILSELQVKLTEGERIRFSGYSKTVNLEAFEKTMEALTYVRAANPESNAIARRLAEESIKLDPNYSYSYNILAMVHIMDVWLGLSKSPRQSLDQAIELLEKSIAIYEDSDLAYSLFCHIYAMKRQFEKSLAAGQKAIELNPNSDSAYDYLAQTLRWVGKSEEAIKLHQEAMRLCPFPPAGYYLNLGHAYCAAGRCEEAIKEYKKTLHLTPNHFIALWGLSVCYGLLGQEEESREAAAEMMKINPNFTINAWKTNSPYKNRDLVERWAEVLRKAGVPEG